MHLYVLAAKVPAVTQERLTAELCDLGGEFALDPATLWSAASESKTLLAAGIHHGPDRCGPRNYVARVGPTLTWFDGLPVDPSGRFAAHDANALQEHWAELDGTLEGQFNAGHIDLESGRIELLLDTLGLVPVFVARHEGGVLASNSATLIERLLGSRLPDPLGISSFMGLGWAAGYRTLSAEVRALEGGSRHVIEDGRVRTITTFGPATLARPRAKLDSVAVLTEQLVALTENAVRGMGHVKCPLTAGRDSRVLAALLLATGEPAEYYTAGATGDADVAIARELAQRFRLPHTITCYDPSSTEIDWTNAAAGFMNQNDGLSSLSQLIDYRDPGGPQSPLDVTLWGVGGEAGRSGTALLKATGTTMPLIRRSVAVQRRLLQAKARDDLMTEDASNVLNTYLDDFVDARLAEGWKPAQIQSAFYQFERYGRHGATGPRRGASHEDIFSPFCSRAFIDYCFAITAGERYVESAHYGILTTLSPELRDHRFESPFPSQHPRLAPAMATSGLLRALVERQRGRMRPIAAANGPDQSPHMEGSFLHGWFEARLELMRELFSNQDSDLWNYVSRPRIQALLAGPETERERHQEALLRATTVFWHFYGPSAHPPPYPTDPSKDQSQATDLTEAVG